MKMHISIRLDERGSAGLKAIIAFAILGACIYAGIQLVPLYWAHWNFEDSVETSVQFAFVNYPRDTEKKLTQDILRLLDDMNAQYEKKNVKIKVDDKNKTIVVEVWYSLKHNLPFYPNPKMFHVKKEYNRRI